MDELDRIFDRDDVALLFAIDAVDHRRERRRLTGAGGPGNENEPARPIGEIGHDLRKPELLEGPDLEGDLPDHHRHAAALLEDVPTEAREILNAEREVQLVLHLEL